MTSALILLLLIVFFLGFIQYAKGTHSDQSEPSEPSEPTHDGAGTASAGDDLAEMFRVELDKLRADALQKIEQRDYWLNVGFLEGAAYGLCTIANEIMPRFNDPEIQARICTAYMEAAKEVFRRYFDDYDEDGFGLGSFNVFIGLSQNVSDRKGPFYTEDMEKYGIDPSVKISDSFGDSDSYVWSDVFLQQSILSATRSDSRAMIESAKEASLHLIDRMNDALEGSHFDDILQIAHEHQRNMDFKMQVVISSFAAYRTITLLNSAGIALHPLRYEALQILQTIFQTHRLHDPIGMLDQFSLAAARGEMIARASMIDHSFIESGKVRSAMHPYMIGIVSLHQSMYFNKYDFVPPDHGLIDYVQESCSPPETMLIQLNLHGKLEGLDDVLPMLSDRSEDRPRNHCPEIPDTGWPILFRRAAELHLENGDYATAARVMARALKTGSDLVAHTGQLLNGRGRLRDIHQLDYHTGVAIEILRRAEAEEVAVPGEIIGEVFLYLAIIRERFRNSQGRRSSPVIADFKLFPEGSVVRSYFRAVDFFKPWRVFLKNAEFASANHRAVRNLYNTQIALHKTAENPEVDLEGDFYAFLQALRKEQAALSESQGETRLGMIDSHYASFDYYSDSGKFVFSVIDSSAVVDREIADLRGTILGLGEAEERARMIPGKITFTVSPALEGVAEEDMDEQFFIPRKAWRLFLDLCRGLTQQDLSLHIIPDGEISRVPFNTLFHLCRESPQDSEEVNLNSVAAAWPSLSYAVHSIAKGIPQRSAENRRGLIVADPDYNLGKTYQSALARLAHGTAEAESIRKHVHADLLAGVKASRENLRLIDSPPFLHIITHILFRDERRLANAELASIYGDYMFTSSPEEAAKCRAVALSGAARFLLEIEEDDDEYGDGILTGADFRDLNLEGTLLVVLSGCDSGLASLDFDQSLQGFVHDILAAGARCIVGSVWPVDDRVSSYFMATFYESLAKGKTTGQAFQAATVQARQSSKRTQEWGGFTLWGDPSTQLPEHLFVG